MTDECEEFWQALQQAATATERAAIQAAAVRAGLFRVCACGKLLEPDVRRCFECRAWRSEADRRHARLFDVEARLFAAEDAERRRRGAAGEGEGKVNP